MTTERRPLLVEAANLEDLMAQLQAMRARHDTHRGKTLVALRRQLSDQVARMAATVRPILDRQGNGADQDAFRHLHSQLLSRLAMHQANWPAVRVATVADASAADYIQSAQVVDEAAVAAIAWLRAWASQR